MRLVSSLIPVIFALLATPPVWARGATLFTDGFSAAAYGDLSIDYGSWEGESLSLFKVKAGVQILRWGPLGLTLGYQKSGFYTAQHNWDRDEGSLRVDYRGPVLESHLFPSAPFHFSLAGSSNRGFLFRREADPAAYDPQACSNCDIILERSRLELVELSAQMGVRVAPETYLSLGAGQRTSRLSSAFEVREGDGTRYRDAESEERSGAETFVFVGLRGTQL